MHLLTSFLQTIWIKATNLDEDYLITTREIPNKDKFDVQLDFDFTERIFKLSYFSVFDIMSIIGGFQASLTPIINQIMPFFVLYYMFQLSEIIRDKIKGWHHKEIRNLITVTRKQLKLVQELSEEGKLKINELVLLENQGLILELERMDENQEDIEPIAQMRGTIVDHLDSLRANRSKNIPEPTDPLMIKRMKL